MFGSTVQDFATAVNDAANALKTATINSELEKQFKEEYGDEELPAHKQNHRQTSQGARLFDSGCVGCRATEEQLLLRQKYGLASVQLTDKERKVINRDEKRRNAAAFMRGE